MGMQERARNREQVDRSATYRAIVEFIEEYNDGNARTS